MFFGKSSSSSFIFFKKKVQTDSEGTTAGEGSLERESDRSSPSEAEVKNNTRSVASSPPQICMAEARRQVYVYLPSLRWGY